MIGVGEELIALCVVALDGRACAVKLQRAQALGERAVVSTAAIGIGRDGLLAVDRAGDHGRELIVGGLRVLLADEGGAVVEPGLRILLIQNDRPKLLIRARQIDKELLGSRLVLVLGLVGRVGGIGRTCIVVGLILLGLASAAGQQRKRQDQRQQQAEHLFLFHLNILRKINAVVKYL